MRKPVERLINGNSYTFCCLPPTQSVPLLIKMLKIVAPSFAKVFAETGSIKGLKEALDKDINFGDLITTFFDRVDPSETMEIITTLFSQVQYKGSTLADILDAHFAGKHILLFKVAKVALEVEYSDFLIGNLGQKTGDHSNQDTTSRQLTN